MDGYNHGTIIKIEENEDVKQYFNEALVIKPEPNRIEKTCNSSPTNHNNYQKTIVRDAYKLHEAGRIKIEVGETEDHYFKSIFEEGEKNELGIEQQKTIVGNTYKVCELKIKIEDETDDYYHGTVNKINIDNEDIKGEFTETFMKETKSTNIEK